MRTTSRLRRAFILAAMMALLSVLLSGCWDRTELNDLAFAMSSAIDKEPDGSYRATYLFALPGQMGGPSGGGGGTGGKESYYVDSAKGATIREAAATMQRRMARRMFLSHRRTILISEEAAREGITDLLDTIPRLPESRLSTAFIVTKGPAYKLLSTTPKFERFPAEAIRELWKTQGRMSVNAKEIAVSLSLDHDPVIIYMGEKQSEKGSKTSKEVEILGYAQFKKDKMVGIYDQNMTNGLKWLRRDVQEYTLTIVSPDDDKPLTLDINTGNSRITPKVEGDTVSFKLDLDVQAKVRENFSKLDLNQTEDLRKVEMATSDKVKESVTATIQAMQKLKTDSADLGNLVWGLYPSEWESKLEPNWQDKFAKAKFNVQVRTNITEVGLVNQNVTRRSY